jgi:hypothetical protein
MAPQREPGATDREPWYRKYSKEWLMCGLGLGLPACFIVGPRVWGCDHPPVLFFVGQCSYTVFGSSLVLLYGFAAKHSWIKIVFSTLLFLVVASVVLAWIGEGMTGAIDRGRQKRTMSDMRSVGEAVAAYIVDNGFCPQASSMEALKTVLEPRYVKLLPLQDAWHDELRYMASEEEPNS